MRTFPQTFLLLLACVVTSAYCNPLTINKHQPEKEVEITDSEVSPVLPLKVVHDFEGELVEAENNTSIGAAVPDPPAAAAAPEAVSDQGKPVYNPGKPNKPGQKPGKPNKPGQKPGKPNKKPGKPGQKPGKPNKKPGKPGQKPGKPNKKPGKPGQKPGKPGRPQKPSRPQRPSGGKPAKPARPGLFVEEDGETTTEYYYDVETSTFDYVDEGNEEVVSTTVPSVVVAAEEVVVPVVDQQERQDQVVPVITSVEEKIVPDVAAGPIHDSSYKLPIVSSKINDQQRRVIVYDNAPDVAVPEN